MGQKARGEAGVGVPGRGLAMQSLGGRRPVSPEDFMVQQGLGGEAGHVSRDKIPEVLPSGRVSELGTLPKSSKVLLEILKVARGSLGCPERLQLSAHSEFGGMQRHMSLSPCLQDTLGIDEQVT